MSLKSLTVEKIAEVVGGRYIGPRSLRNDRIASVSIDSREVEPDGLFVCIKGERFDGHSFALQAVEERGAKLCLAEEELTTVPYIRVANTRKALRDLAAYYRRLFKIPVVGIVGSVGKTTAKELTARVLSRHFLTLKTPENYNNELGVPLTILKLREEHEAAVVEMGISDFGEMRRLAAIVRPDICVVTSIGYCHLEKLGDLQGVLKAKSEVFEFMESNAVAVLNGDDEMLRDLDTGTRKILYGAGPWNDVRAENVENLGATSSAALWPLRRWAISWATPARRFYAASPITGLWAAGPASRTQGISPSSTTATTPTPTPWRRPYVP